MYREKYTFIDVQRSFVPAVQKKVYIYRCVVYREKYTFIDVLDIQRKVYIYRCVVFFCPSSFVPVLLSRCRVLLSQPLFAHYQYKDTRPIKQSYKPMKRGLHTEEKRPRKRDLYVISVQIVQRSLFLGLFSLVCRSLFIDLQDCFIGLLSLEYRSFSLVYKSLLFHLYIGLISLAYWSLFKVSFCWYTGLF